MKKLFAVCGAIVVSFLFLTASLALEQEVMETKSIYDKVSKETVMKDGVLEITYEQFKEIRDSGEKYILIDTLPTESYASGHIEGAISFPADTINKESTEKLLSKNDNIIVYCGSFSCGASTYSAETLSGLGYKVLDYKGGLKEYQEKGEVLVK